MLHVCEGRKWAKIDGGGARMLWARLCVCVCMCACACVSLEVRGCE